MYREEPYITKKRDKLILLLLLLCVHFTVIGQENFSRISANKTVWKKDALNVSTTLGWKHLYESPNWSRIDLSGNLSYQLKQWRLLSGLSNYYVFDNEIDNYLEVRPWIGIRLLTPVFSTIQLEQTIKGEWRNFLYLQGESDNETKWRSRYALKLEFDLFENKEKQTRWFSSLGVELYFNKNQATGERFASSREYTAEIGYQFKSLNKVAFKYYYEKNTDFFTSSEDRANTFALIFSFR